MATRLARRVTAPLIIGFATILFTAPMFKVADGIASSDAFRNNDWLNCRSFDLMSRQAILEHGQFPLRSHLVGGGFPTIAHPSDGTWAPTLLAVLLLGDVLGVKVNLVLFFLAGAMGVWLLARRWLGLDPLPSLFGALLFLFSGWAPSMMLVGFYNQIFFLLTPLIMYLLLGAAKRPVRLLWAGMLLCLVLQQGGHAFISVTHFLFLLGWFGVAAEAPAAGPAWRRWLVAVGLMLPITFSAALARECHQPLLLLAGIAPVAAWLALHAAPRLHLGRFVPHARSLGLVLLICGSLGALRVVGLVYMKANGSYPVDARRQGMWFKGDQPDLYWLERYYEDPEALLRGLTSRVPAHGGYGELFGRAGETIEYEYAFLGLTWAPLLLCLVGLAGARASPRLALLGALALFYLLISCGWNLPPDLHFLFIWGIPWLGELGQPIKYFNFFMLLPMVLLAAAGAQRIAALLPAGRARVVGGAAVALVLFFPLHQNWPMLGESFALPRPAAPREKFYQVAMVGDQDWIPRGDPWIRARGAGELLRGLRRPRVATEYYNIRRGIGTVDWYGSAVMAEHAVPRRYITPRGEELPNPRYKGEAWTLSGNGKIRSLALLPNSTSLDLELPAADRVVINQNHLYGFNASVGEVVDQGGLLAVSLPAGRHRVELIYRPWFFLAGMAASAGSLVLWIVAMVLLRRRRAPAVDAAEVAVQ